MVKKLMELTQEHESSPVADWLIFSFGALSLATALSAAFMIS